MADVHDLRYILPRFAGVLEAARQRGLARQDYLLTAAVLAQVGQTVLSVNHASLYTSGRGEAFRPGAVGFVFYEIRPGVEAAAGSRDGGNEDYDVVLGGVVVARWTVVDTMGMFETALESLEGAERAICSALGMANEECTAVLGTRAGEGLRPGSRGQQGEDEDLPFEIEPKMELVDVDLFREKCFTVEWDVDGDSQSGSFDEQSDDSR